MKNPGIVYELPDGRRAIAYARQQGPQFGGKKLLKLVDRQYQPIISTQTGKQACLIRDVKGFNLIGFID